MCIVLQRASTVRAAGVSAPPAAPRRARPRPCILYTHTSMCINVYIYIYIIIISIIVALYQVVYNDISYMCLGVART